MTNCGNCGGPMRADQVRGVLVCDHCGSELELPVPAIDGLELLTETPSPCPLCAAPLSTARLDGHPLLCCPRCLGMLIEMTQLLSIVDAVRVREGGAVRTTQRRRQNPGDRLLHCPTCGQPMISHIYGGPGNVVIDTCERCRVNWLDAGELRQIAFAPEGPHSFSDDV